MHSPGVATPSPRPGGTFPTLPGCTLSPGLLCAPALPERYSVPCAHAPPTLWPFRSMPRARRGLRLSLFRLSHWHEQFDGASMKHAALNAHTRSGGTHRCSRLRFLAPRHFVILPDTMRYGGVHCSTACYCGVFLMTVVELKITHFLT